MNFTYDLILNNIESLNKNVIVIFNKIAKRKLQNLKRQLVIPVGWLTYRSIQGRRTPVKSTVSDVTSRGHCIERSKHVIEKVIITTKMPSQLVCPLKTVNATFTILRCFLWWHIPKTRMGKNSPELTTF